MKIVFASTPSQEEEIYGLVGYIYSTVFPLYFSDDEIRSFEQLKVLHTSSKQFEDFSTLKDAFQVMTSMQTIISILESPTLDDQYSSLFNKNVSNLQEFGLFFPFEYDQFVEAKNMKNSIFSIYTKAANELII
ncbi:YhcU family protein [Bacillus sp. UNC438CL73TsuS30]|uniref:YhcU family protein n=1 Tax=Bacillus sp. UNC438CL73TsuS30 TaxID=1340434 RepID=UPI00047D9FC9|nr:YhcU family protein [Bacillus sp. UNC438CL73TsuS30]